MSTIANHRPRAFDGPLPPDGLVHNSVYRDPHVFELEQQAIFRRTWSFVAHESELPEPGCYLTAIVAGNPVLLIKDKASQLRAFYNVCRHRGATVLEGEGQCEVIRCPYHWWVYTLSGELIGQPQSRAYDGTGFERRDFGLVQIPLASCHGLLFVTLDQRSPSLEEFLGPRAWEVLRRPLGECGMEVVHKQVFDVPGNWKIVTENQRDGYHVPFVHPLFRSSSPPLSYELLPEGHGLQWTVTKVDGIPEELRERTSSHPLPGFEDHGGFILNIFPDLMLQVRNNFFMVSSSDPVDSRRTIVTRRILGLVGDPDEVRQVRLDSAEAFGLGTYADEDMPVLIRQQRGLENDGVPVSVIARQANQEAGVRGDDNRLRQWWHCWRQHMGVEHNVSPYLDDE